MNDIHISGTGTVTPGQYDSVTVSGMGKCPGALRADEITVNGTFKVEGSSECRKLTVNGTFKGQGALSAEEVVCNGAATVEDDMTANTLSVAGVLHCEGDKLQSRELSCAGILTMDGLVSCDQIHVTGILKAEQLEGRSIRIRSHRPELLRRFWLSKGLSRVDYIQGEEVELSGVTAETVTGTNITIGPDCNIERIRCNGTLKLDPTAVVEDIAGDYKMR